MFVALFSPKELTRTLRIIIAIVEIVEKKKQFLVPFVIPAKAGIHTIDYYIDFASSVK